MHSEAIAHPNIALIKYWGNREDILRLPANGSISLTLGGLQNRMSVWFDGGIESDTLVINDAPAEPKMVERASKHLDLLRGLADVADRAELVSETNFPLGAGIASSAAAFAAITVAAASALHLELNSEELSRIARRGSGSAARSIQGGFVELLAGDSDKTSFAQQIAPEDYWPIVDLVVIVDEQVKHTGSSTGHSLAASSPLQESRVADAPRRLQVCRNAILERNFPTLTQIVERDSDMMHAIMMTSEPPLHFWTGATLQVMAVVRELRAEGISVCYTIDAGPNVHCLCLPESERDVRQALTSHENASWTVLRAQAGPAAQVV